MTGCLTFLFSKHTLVEKSRVLVAERIETNRKDKNRIEVMFFDDVVSIRRSKSIRGYSTTRFRQTIRWLDLKIRANSRNLC